MWMPPLEPSWAGKVEFYELVFGTWTVYVFLVLFWQRVMREPLEEWRYAMITFLGAGAFWVNHYFLKAPSPTWLVLINLYTVFFIFFYWRLGVRGRERSAGWKLLGLASSMLFTVVFILLEQLARRGVERWGMNEFCWMSISFIGFAWLIWWRGHTSVRPRPEPAPYWPKPQWRGDGGTL
jgi:hypothetical protein